MATPDLSFSLNTAIATADFGAHLVIWGIAIEAIDLIAKCGEHEGFCKWFGSRFEDLNLNRLKWFSKVVHPWALAVEITSFALVVYGLSIEVSGSNEAYRLSGRQNAVLNDRASSNEVTAKQLEIQLNQTKTQLANSESRLIELQTANLPMDLKNEGSFIPKMFQMRGVQVKLRNASDSKSRKVADELFTDFSVGGWMVIDRGVVGDIQEEGIIIGQNQGDAASKEAAMLVFTNLIEMGIPSKIVEDSYDLNVLGVPTNGIIVAVCNRPEPATEKLMLVKGKLLELQYQPVEIEMKMWNLKQKKFIPNSEELISAQRELNGLASEFNEVNNEINALNETEKKLESEVNKPLFDGVIRVNPANNMPVDERPILR